MGLHVLGVRHHSPACAGWVKRCIERIRPGAVLVEGPVDFTPRMHELLLDHAPPVALFSYYRDGPATRGSWSPFCAYSPEWVALRTAHEVGAALSFIDLPAWHDVFHEVENRYRDRAFDRMPDLSQSWAERLAEAFSADGYDAVWDHAFEQPLDDDVRAERHATYFSLLREANPAGARDEQREAFMAAHIGQALDEHEDVVVVCGGFHQPALQDWAASAPAPVLEAPGPDASWGTYLVPYSFFRLDSFIGYEAGMPSPGFYQLVWERGPEAAPDLALQHIVSRLRQKKQTCSTADLIAARTMAEGLARLRGHQAVQRVDLLDGVAASLVKGALDAPLPWTQRGTIKAHTDPLLVEVLKVLSGDARGRLHPDTPRPPLLFDVDNLLAQHQIPFTRDEADVRLDLQKGADRDKSALLHRLSLLEVIGVRRVAGPASHQEVDLSERWILRRTLETEASLIEAGAYGGTLEGAARRRLSEMLEADAPLPELVDVLLSARFAALADIDARALEAIGRGIGHAKLPEVGPALLKLLGVRRHDAHFTTGHQDASLPALIDALTERALWLFDMTTGAEAELAQSHLDLALALRDVVRHAAPSAATAVAVREAFARRALDDNCPPALRGASWGGHISLVDDDRSAHRLPADRGAMLRTAHAAALGDFLTGLFYLARDVIGTEPELLRALHEVLSELQNDEFLSALPSMRLSFSFFPPREREAIARVVAGLLGQGPAAARRLLHLTVTPDTFVAGAELDEQIMSRGAGYGWWPEQT